MKVCVFGTRGFPRIEGGVEKHCEMLYPLLDENIEIIIFRRKTYVCSDTVYKNISFIDLPSTRIKGVEALMHSFLATLHCLVLRPDVVHIHNIGPALFAPILKLFSLPVVLTYHSPNYEHKKWGRFAKSLLKFSEQIALKFSDRIIFVNNYQMQKYPEEVQKKSVYIPNGINKPVVSEAMDYLQEIGVESGKYILSVGRITPEKGFHDLIRAFCLASTEEYKLVIAGGVEFESGYMEELRNLSNGLPVIFTGYVYGDTLAQLYSNAALFVLASENEGFPLVLLEAMSYSRNVLVSDIPATHLVKLPENAYFPVGDTNVLASKIKEELSNPTEVRFDLSEYNWLYIAQQVSNILQKTKE